MVADLSLVNEVAEAADYLAVFAVARPDGTVHASLVKAGILDDPVDNLPAVGIVVAGGARKLRILRQVGFGTVVFTDRFRWVSVEGPVRLIGPDDPITSRELRVSSVIRAVYRAAGGTHNDWEEFDRAMLEDRRCAVLVRGTKFSSNG